MAPEVIRHKGERRLDHPDFSDVYRTSFGKGTIVELKRGEDIWQDTEGLVKLESMARVEIGGRQTDYLPIFYKPKEQYWDLGDLGATDFDDSQKCYKTAWMSFRPGDEVVVLLFEGRPGFILGFADHYPRIGENVIKFDYNGTVNCFRIFPERQLFYHETGPDGRQLDLTVKAKIIAQNEEQKEGGRSLYDEAGSACSKGGKIIYFEHYRAYAEYPPVRAKTVDAKIALGPYMAVIQLKFVFDARMKYTLYSVDEHGQESFVQELSPGKFYPHYATKFDMDCNPTEWNTTRYFDIPDPGQAADDWLFAGHQVLMAPFEKATFDSVEPVEYVSPFYGFNKYDEKFVPVYGFSFDFGDQKGDGIEITSHPHSKEELMAAGLWPVWD